MRTIKTYVSVEAERKGIGDMINIEGFVSMLLNSMRKAGLPVANVERLHENKYLFGVELSDKSEFLLKVGKRDAEQEAYLAGLDETDSKIHDIYERFANTPEFNNSLMHNDFDIDWLQGELEPDDYLKLEDYILYYCSRNDELLFRLGFKYAWALFHECAGKEKVTVPEKNEI